MTVGRRDRSATDPPIPHEAWPRTGLIEGDAAGRVPWAPRKILAALLLPIAVSLALGTWWAADHIENDIEAAAPTMLADNGIDPTGLFFDADYRNIEVSGTLPEGARAFDIERILEDQQGASEDEDIRSASVTAEAPMAAGLGPVSVAVDADGTTITLVGNVPSNDHSDLLMAAAAEAVGAANVTNNLTVSGLEPSSTDPDGQVEKLAAILPGLGSGVVSANLAVGDSGDVAGSIEAADADSAAAIAAVAGPGVNIDAPMPLGSLAIRARFDGTRVILDGDVLSAEQSAVLEDAAAEVVGMGNVVNNLTVLDQEERVHGSDGKVEALATAIEAFAGMNAGDAVLNDTDLTINGEATDEDGRDAINEAIEASAEFGLRPGGTITVGEPVLTLQDEIDLLQSELDNLQDEIRENVVFPTDSDELDEVAMATLDKVVDVMGMYQRPVVETGGHTDSQGNEALNLELSQRRADAVVAYIVEQGIDANRLNPVGYGESRPIADNLIEEGRRQNRRVEFIAQESF